MLLARATPFDSIKISLFRQNHCSESGVGIASENDQDRVFLHLFRPLYLRWDIQILPVGGVKL